jgi:hypothetical protein
VIFEEIRFLEIKAQADIYLTFKTGGQVLLLLKKALPNCFKTKTPPDFLLRGN